METVKITKTCTDASAKFTETQKITKPRTWDEKICKNGLTKTAFNGIILDM